MCRNQYFRCAKLCDTVYCGLKFHAVYKSKKEDFKIEDLWDFSVALIANYLLLDLIKSTQLNFQKLFAQEWIGIS